MNQEKIYYIKNGLFEDMKKNGHVESYILDSNIVIKLRDLYYNPDSLEEEDFLTLLNLIDNLKEKKVRCHVALQELSWDFENFCIDKTKFMRLEEAVVKTLTSTEVIERIKMKQKYISEIVVKKKGQKILESLYDNCKENAYLLPTMCVLLKFKLLLKNYNLTPQNDKIYLQMSSFIHREVGMVGAYEMLLIQDILFYEDEQKVSEVKSLLKLNTKDTNKSLWNSSWDILYMRTIFSIVVDTKRGILKGIGNNPILVTMDENLAKLSSYFNERITIAKINGIPYPALKSIRDDQEANAAILAVQMTLAATAKERTLNNNKLDLNARVEKLKKVVSRLEREFVENK
jgi:hypothetical protein